MWTGLVCVKKIILPVISIQKKFGMAGIRLLIVLKPWWFNWEKIAIQASIDQQTTKLIRVEDLCEIERINLIQSLGVSYIAISYIVSSNILKWKQVIFLFDCFFVFFLGVVVVACYILRTNVKEISILMSVNKLKNLNLDQYRF